jgi:hypothetical protein
VFHGKVPTPSPSSTRKSRPVPVRNHTRFAPQPDRPSSDRCGSGKNPLPQYAFKMSMFNVSAIHINSRSWLRSSSTHEPSDPPLRIVCFGLYLRSLKVFRAARQTLSCVGVSGRTVQRRRHRCVAVGARPTLRLPEVTSETSMPSSLNLQLAVNLPG